MKLTTLACLAALGLIGPATLALAAPPAAPQGQAQPQGQVQPQGQTQPPAQAQPQGQAQTQAAPARAGQPAARGSDRRRRSYAACNRASHQRGLRGGKRRRFMIRCRLGLERPRNPGAVQPAGQPPAPAPAERKP